MAGDAAAGGEVMVVKPLTPIVNGGGLAQPALKVRGSEYLRINLRDRSTWKPGQPGAAAGARRRRKRGLALRELALGIEGLERFARHEPLCRVHECVAGVLALESGAGRPETVARPPPSPPPRRGCPSPSRGGWGGGLVVLGGRGCFDPGVRASRACELGSSSPLPPIRLDGRCPF